MFTCSRLTSLVRPSLLYCTVRYLSLSIDLSIYLSIYHPSIHHQPPFRYADGFEDFTYTYPCSREPYEGTELQIERLRWLEAAKVLHGPFVPGGVDKPLNTGASRALLPQVLTLPLAATRC